MTKDHSIISLQLTNSQIAEIDTEAQAPPFLTNRSTYLRSVVLGRHQMVIEATPEVEKLTQYHQLKVSQLKQENTSLYERLANLEPQIRAETQQYYAQQTQQYIDVRLQKATLQMKYEYLEENHKALNQKHQLILAQLRACESDKARLTKELNQTRELSEWAEKITKGLSNVLGQSPVLQERLKTDGLAGLFSGSSSKESSGPSAVSADERLGQALRVDFPGPKLEVMLDVLRFLRDVPTYLSELIASKAYQSFQAHNSGKKAVKQN